MFQHAQVNPIYKKGKNGAGALLLHGFTATPDIMRPLANHLHDRGFSVLAPLLPGHGGTRESLATSTWSDWYGGTLGAFDELAAECSKICVAGLSLGGLLALKLAEDRPESVRALACLATPLQLDKWVHWLLPAILNTPLRFVYRYQRKAGLDIANESAKANVWHIPDMPLAAIQSLTKLQEAVRNDLQRVVSPTLVIHARDDATAPYHNMSLIAQGITAAVTETVTLEKSRHLVTIDWERDLVSEKVGAFFSRFV